MSENVDFVYIFCFVLIKLLKNDAFAPKFEIGFVKKTTDFVYVPKKM